MNEVDQPIESKKFIRILVITALLWLGIGILVHLLMGEQVIAFIQIFLFSFLDLVFLMLLFWSLFFLKPDQKRQRVNKIRIALFMFFKLVCLAFLAITLKRLRNASIVTHVMGVSVIWITPFISGLLLKHFNKLEKTKV